MKSALFVLGVLSLAACAPPVSTAPTASPDVDAITAVSDTHVLKGTGTDLHEDIVVDAPKVEVLNALKDAYAALGIEMKFSNPTTAELGNLDFAKIHSIGGTLLHNYLNCGHTSTGLAADSYRIRMSMVSMVIPEGSLSRIQTRLKASAWDIATSNNPRDCQSLGTLERRLHQLVKTKLAM